MPTNSQPHPVDKPKTCKRYNEPGDAHALTFSCFRRQAFLSRERTRGWMIDAIRLSCERHDLDLWAYVIMPEHVHIVVHPRLDPYDISRILSSLKQPVSKRAILHVKQNAPSRLKLMTGRQSNGKTSFRFWQRGGGYDRNLWSPRYVWQTIDYIHGNPVQRNLCARDIDWHWSSARAYAGLGHGPLDIDAESLPTDPRQMNAL